MPRGVKGSGVKPPNKSIEDKIAEQDDIIKTCKSKIAEANRQKKALLETKEKQDAVVLLDIMKETGMTAQQLLDIVKGTKKAK